MSSTIFYIIAAISWVLTTLLTVFAIHWLLRRNGILGNSIMMAVSAHVAGAMTSGCVVIMAGSWIVFGSMASYQVKDMQFVLWSGLPILIAGFLLLPITHFAVYKLFRAGETRRLVMIALGSSGLTLLITLLQVAGLLGLSRFGV